MQNTKIIFTIVFSIVFNHLYAQFNYQAAVRDSNNQPIINKVVLIEVDILEKTNVIYQESHLINTGKMGIVNLLIGNGINATADFSEIDWSKTNYKIQILVDGEELPATPINAVPIAEYARNGIGQWQWNENNQSLSFNEGKVGIGLIPEYKFEVAGDILTNSSYQYGAHHWDDDGIGSNMLIDPGWSSSRSDYVDFYVPGNTDESETIKMSMLRNGNVGIGITKPRVRLEVAGDILSNSSYHYGWPHWQDDGVGSTVLFDPGWSPERGDVVDFYVPGNLNENELIRMTMMDNGNVGIGYTKPKARLDVNGKTRTKVLEITGGADGCEYFQINEPSKLEPGSLVIIDEVNEGKLKLSTKAYDTKIAGVISGAGGVQPGITLKQEEVLEGDQLVSLWGRVYVQATNQNGNIKPGDLLTSSKKPGVAMKCTKRKKAKHAIIGKALTSLRSDKGLVLILIQPQ